MTFAEWFGLILTILCVVVAGGVLIYDAIRRWVLKIPTISIEIWMQLAAWKKGEGPSPIWGIILPAWFLTGTIGLAMHFFL